MALLGRIADAVAAAESVGVLRPGPQPLVRTVVWAAAPGGVLAAEDLGRYLLGLAGGQLARQLNVDQCVGWGADAAVDRG